MPRKSKKYKSPREKALFKIKEELDLITADFNQKKSDTEKAEQVKQAKEIELKKAKEAQAQAQANYQNKLNFVINLKEENKTKSDAADIAADQLAQAEYAKSVITADEGLTQCHSPLRAVTICTQQNQERLSRNQQKHQQRQQADNNIKIKQKAKVNTETEAKDAITKVNNAEVEVGHAKIAAGSATDTKNTVLKEFDKAKKLHEDTQLILAEADDKKIQVEISFTEAQKEFQQEIDLLFGDSGEKDINMHDHSSHKVDLAQETIIENTQDTTQCVGNHIDKYDDYPIYHLSN